MKKIIKYISIGIVFIATLFCTELIFCLVLTIFSEEAIKGFFECNNTSSFSKLARMLVIIGVVGSFLIIPLAVTKKYKDYFFGVIGIFET